MDGKSRLVPITSSQLGAFTRSQAAAVGISRHQLDRAVATGELHRPFRSTYVDAAVPRSWRQDALAAVLACGPFAVLSHRAAVALHELEERTVAPRPIEVSVPPGDSVRLPGVVVHRVILPGHHVTKVGPIPVTTVARTLADASGFRSEERLGAMVDTASLHGLVRGDLEEVLETLESCRGRRLARVRSVLAVRGLEGQKAESHPELRVYRAVVAAGLPAPVQQHWVFVGDERYRLDLAYPDVKLALEYLGFDAHSSPRALQHDAQRDRLLTVAGWEILYFTRADSDATIAHDVGSRVLAR